MYLGGGVAPLILGLGTTCRLSGQFHASAILPLKKSLSLTHSRETRVCSGNRPGLGAEDRNVFSLPGNKPWTVGCPSHSLVTLPTFCSAHSVMAPRRLLANWSFSSLSSALPGNFRHSTSFIPESLPYKSCPIQHSPIVLRSTLYSTLNWRN